MIKETQVHYGESDPHDQSERRERRREEDGDQEAHDSHDDGRQGGSAQQTSRVSGGRFSSTGNGFLRGNAGLASLTLTTAATVPNTIPINRPAGALCNSSSAQRPSSTPTATHDAIVVPSPQTRPPPGGPSHPEFPSQGLKTLRARHSSRGVPGRILGGFVSGDPVTKQRLNQVNSPISNSATPRGMKTFTLASKDGREHEAAQ